jgi:hypothetical protein
MHVDLPSRQRFAYRAITALIRLVGYMRGYKLILARLNGSLVPGLPRSVHLPASETPLITITWYSPLQHPLRISRGHDNHVKDELPSVMEGSEMRSDYLLVDNDE